MARMAASILSVSVSVSVTATSAASTAPRRLAVMVPIKVSVFAGVIPAVVIINHVKIVVICTVLLRIQPLV